MQRDSGVTMLLRLLGLLVLSSVCSGMLLANMSNKSIHPLDDGGSGDPNTFDWPGNNGSPPPGGNNMGQARGGMMYDNSSDGYMQAIPPFPPLDSSLCDMLLNAPEPPPLDQIPYHCICSHCKGTTGPKGDRGDRGTPGQPGSPGRRGLTGFRGRPGFTGPPGIKGQKGDIGEKGQVGTMGFNGMKGARGFKGEKGDRGLEGPPGLQGPQGETGTCPASCESVQGPPGPQGPVGPPGTRGLPGTLGLKGEKGHKGDMGDLGVPGNPGMDGQKGDQGEQGLCECTDGERGADGTKGQKGDVGEKGDTGSKGTEGQMGPKGEQGTMGMMGIPGPCSPAIQSAFSAGLNASFPIKDWPIAFTNVFLNIQGHFNPSMGIYTAPINGTYVFTYNLAVRDKILKVGLFHNFYPVIKTTEGTNIATTSQTIVLHLNMLDQVWLQVKDEETNGMYTDGESASTFSGYLLNPDSCDYPMNRHHGPLPTPPVGGYQWD